MIGDPKMNLPRACRDDGREAPIAKCVDGRCNIDWMWVVGSAAFLLRIRDIELKGCAIFIQSYVELNRRGGLCLRGPSNRRKLWQSGGNDARPNNFVCDRREAVYQQNDE